MKERPILFSGSMVRAILNGTKTQTRRVVKRQPPERFGVPRTKNGLLTFHESEGDFFPAWIEHQNSPYGAPGDRLWVRETWRTDSAYDPCPPRTIDPVASLYFLADQREYRINHRPECGPLRWGKVRTCLHMPRWASRILLDVVSIRVERLQDITEGDAKAEGVYRGTNGHFADYPNGETVPGWRHAKESFRTLWNSINSARKLGWAVNPWVWVIEFRRALP